MVPSVGGRERRDEGGGRREREEEEGMALWGFVMSRKSTLDHVILRAGLNDLAISLNHSARSKATTDEEGFLCFLFSTIV